MTDEGDKRGLFLQYTEWITQ